MVITIDGPAGVGKTTTAKKLASKLGYQYLDTGAMYRAVTYFLRESSVDISSEAHVRKMLDILNLELDFSSYDNIKVYIDDKNVSSLIRTQEITEKVSEISALAAVRKRMVRIQKDTVKNGNFVVEGRDIGSVILPNADIKFYFTCSLNVAAKRRFNELRKTNKGIKLSDVKKSIKIRNYRDKNRKNSPLIQSKDAVIVRTDKLKNIKDMVNSSCRCCLFIRRTRYYNINPHTS
mgnify:CR=1 FL=1